MNEYKEFTFLGEKYFFTKLFDNTSSYSFGGRYLIDGKLVKNTAEYWHKVGFGIYRKSDNWRF